MNRQTIVLAVTLGSTLWVMGCGSGPSGAKAAEAVPLDQAAEEASGASSFVEREFWLALAEEPGWHMTVARDDFRNGRVKKASEELEKVASILNFEVRHSHSPRERGLLLGSVQELREVSRELRHDPDPPNGIPTAAEVDRVIALAFRTLATHQVALGRDALEAGDARMAGRYIQEAATAVESGFEVADVDPGTAMMESLQAAHEVGVGLMEEGEGSRREGLESLNQLDGAVEGLSNVLTSRRK